MIALHEKGSFFLTAELQFFFFFSFTPMASWNAFCWVFVINVRKDNMSEQYCLWNNFQKPTEDPSPLWHNTQTPKTQFSRKARPIISWSLLECILLTNHYIASYQSSMLKCHFHPTPQVWSLGHDCCLICIKCHRFATPKKEGCVASLCVMSEEKKKKSGCVFSIFQDTNLVLLKLRFDQKEWDPAICNNVDWTWVYYV